MAKEKNSLGLCVLPFPEPMTNNVAISWEYYKKLTGIDLSDIFVSLKDGGDYGVKFNKSFTKLLAIREPEEFKSQLMALPAVTYVVPGNIHIYFDADIDSGYMQISVLDDPDDQRGYYVLIGANKTIMFNEA